MIKQPPKIPPKKQVTYTYDIKKNPVFRRLFKLDPIKLEDIKIDIKQSKGKNP